MINLTKDEFSEVVAETIKEFAKAVEDDALVPILLTICAMIGARAEIKTEDKKETQKLYSYYEVYRAGDWTISIEKLYRSHNKTRLIIKYGERTRLNTIVDSVHAAYDYAFNILVK